MIWLQTIAFLVLACLTQAQNGCSSFLGMRNNAEAVSYVDNSFPYYHIKKGAKNEDLYGSSIVSLSSGPLCSGFHLSKSLVITAASCVFRETAKDLVVISHSLAESTGPKLYYLPVNYLHINSRYDFKSGEHDFAVLLVNNTAHVPILKMPSLGSTMSNNADSMVFMMKYSFNEEMNEFSLLTVPVDANLNTKKCTSESHGINLFLCVSQLDQKPYSYGLMDRGLPLIYRSPEGDFFSGMFAGQVYNAYKDHYLYQNVYSSFDFLNSYANPKTWMRGAFK